MLDLRLAQLRHFLLVVETKNYRTAARRAFKSQPAFSQSIRQLEARLGQPLFEKSARTTLTPFGESCLPLVREMVKHIERSTRSMIDVAQLTGGSVAIAILPSIATLWLPALLRSFNARYPRVEVRVLAEDSASVQRLVAAGEVDVGVSSLGQADPRIDFQPLLQDRFGVLCRADHAFAKSARPLAWEALRGQTILGNVMHRLLAESEVAALVAHPHIQVSNLPTLLALVEEGLGVTPIPALAFPPNRRALAFAPLVRPVKTRTIGTMAPAGRSLLPAAQALIDLLREHGREDRRRNRAR